MLKLLLALLLLVPAVALLPGPSSHLHAQDITVPLNIRLRDANTRFSFKLLSELTRNQTTANIFVSPINISLALSSLSSNAPRPTRRTIASALEFRNLSLDQVSEGTAFLQSSLTSPDPRMSIALERSLATQTSTETLPLNTRFAGSDPVRNPDRTTGRATATNQVPITLKVSSDFKAPWSLAFFREQEAEQLFTLSNGKQKNVELISRVGIYRYLETREFQAINLPYGKDGLWSMVLFLPSTNTPLRTLLRALNEENWSRWSRQLALRDGTITLPRFGIDYSNTLGPALKTIGLTSAFDPATDLRRAGPDRVRLSEVIHKASIQVTETGIITSRTSTDNSMLPPTLRPKLPPFIMRVDRPFFFVIHDNSSGLILFLGSVIDPTL